MTTPESSNPDSPANPALAPFELGPAILFCPADRPERYGKAAERADAVILDLEDAVGPDAKEAARDTIEQAFADPQAAGIETARTVIRVNAADSEHHAADLELCVRLQPAYAMLAKAESAQQAQELAGRLPNTGIIALCETAAGIMAAREIAQVPGVVALMWGAEDLIASMGGRSSRTPEGRYRAVAQQARSTVLLSARAAGKGALDAVYVNIPDLEGLAAEAQDAAASGFSATACIHPSQAQTIRAAYAPTEQELDYAQRVLEAAEQNPGVFTFEGQMVDEPLLRHARSVMARSVPDKSAASAAGS